KNFARLELGLEAPRQKTACDSTASASYFFRFGVATAVHLKEKVKKSSSTDDDITHPCTRFDLAVVLLYFQLFIPDKYAKSLYYCYQIYCSNCYHLTQKVKSS
ncbi:hypothetical protein, partial [Agriterribacter humi]|uniref:hypothetical protein n=1 Tax=Agriterribacter humi TaxID=1104781 RepID=UPI001D01537F